MTNKSNISVLIKEDSKGKINSIFTTVPSKNSTFKIDEIETSNQDLSWSLRRPYGVVNYNNIVLFPVTTKSPYDKNGMIYSEDDGYTWHYATIFADGEEIQFTDTMSRTNGNSMSLLASSGSNNSILVSANGIDWFKNKIKTSDEKSVTPHPISSVAYTLGYVYGVNYNYENKTVYIHRKKIGELEGINEFSGEWELVNSFTTLWTGEKECRIFALNRMLIIYSEMGNSYISRDLGATFSENTKFNNIAYIKSYENFVFMASNPIPDGMNNECKLFVCKVYNDSELNTTYIYETTEHSFVDIQAIEVISNDLFVANKLNTISRYTISSNGIEEYETVEIEGATDIFGIAYSNGNIIIPFNKHIDDTAVVYPFIYTCDIGWLGVRQTLIDTFYDYKDTSYENSILETATEISTLNLDNFFGLLLTPNGRYPAVNGVKQYSSSLILKGEKIKELKIIFTEESYPAQIIINNTIYNNNSPYFNVKLNEEVDVVQIIFFGLYCEDEAPLGISRIATNNIYVFNRANGLKEITIDGVNSDIPNYGIISYSGTLKVADSNNIFLELSQNNLLPTITIEVYINDEKKYEFSSNNDIDINNITKEVTIELIDKIQDIQSYKTKQNMYFTDITGSELIKKLSSEFGYPVALSENVNSFLRQVKINSVYIKIDNWWNIWNSFCVGTKTNFLKGDSGNFIIKG